MIPSRFFLLKGKENFSVVWRATASGGVAVQSFRSKLVRAKFRIEHKIKQKSYVDKRKITVFDSRIPH